MNDKDASGRVPVVFNWGMGVESSADLAELLENPAARDFDLADMVVVTSMTGDEFPDTKELGEAFVLPLLRAHGVRFVQLARKAATRDAAGGENVVVLDDSRSPTALHLGGAYKLSDEMLAAGTVPTTAGDRLCSIHAKGEVIDSWLVHEFLPHPAAPFRHLIGFNADETNRAADDRAADAKRKARGEMLGRRPEFRLIDRGWTRAKCLESLRERFGVTWRKSACSFCPFSRGKDEVRERFRRYPAAAADAVWMEHLSLALNPRLKLYESKSVREVLLADGNAAALDLFAARLDDPAVEWAVYRVRRLYRGIGLADRHVGVVYRGTRAGAEAEVRRLAALRGVEAGTEEGSWRAWLVRRAEPPKRKKVAGKLEKVVYKGVEEMLVACPRVAREKSARGWTEEKWEARLGLATVAPDGAVPVSGCAA